MFCNDKPFYEDASLGLRFTHNPRDGPSAYDIVIGEDHFYLPDRCLREFVADTTSAEDVGRLLRALNPVIDFILKRNNVNYKDTHIVFLKVKIKEDMRLRDYLLQQLREAQSQTVFNEPLR